MPEGQSAGQATDVIWTAAEVVEATGGHLGGETGFAATGVTFDSREVQPGDLFVALQGVRDGHDFVAQAFASGAAGALVSRPMADGPCVIVPDTLKGLEALGGYARDRAPHILRGAVTGSVGKTGVTQMVMRGLSRAGNAHASVKSFNNHIGVPLTLARMPKSAQRAVFEIGMNHANEITPLSKMVQPHAVVITTVGPVHTENFADGERGVAQAKAEIFDGLGPQGLAILNGDNPWFDLLKAKALQHGARVARFGVDEAADARLLDFRADGAGSRIEARIWGRDYVFALKQTGFHHGMNAMAVLLMLDALDVPIETGLEALADFTPLAGRGQIHTITGPKGTFALVDESYNANPLSMRASLANLCQSQPGPGGRRIAVLTDMLELGADAAEQHALLAQTIETDGIDLVFCAGPMMKHLWDVLPQGAKGGYALEAAGLVSAVQDAVREGDVVMVKGSNGSRASLLTRALTDRVQNKAEPETVSSGVGQG